MPIFISFLPNTPKTLISFFPIATSWSRPPSFLAWIAAIFALLSACLQVCFSHFLPHQPPQSGFLCFSQISMASSESESEVVSNSATPWTVAYQAPPSTGFSRQDHWRGLPILSPEDLPDPGIEPRSPGVSKTLYRLSHQGSPTGS